MRQTMNASIRYNTLRWRYELAKWRRMFAV
jgi:hypothetical protein